MLERVLDFQLTLVELVCAAVLLAVPYLAIGIAWASTHSAHFEQLHGLDLTASLLGSIALWPVLGFTGGCVA
ncbi:hypothetical protein [Mycobacterium kyorinense]